MTDRSVSIQLIARVQGFVAGIKTAQASVATFNANLAKSAKNQQALRELGNAAGVMGVVAAAAFVGVVKSAADFDQAMSNVQAATHETSANMGLLRQAALDAGQATVFSATESASAIEELAKAGLTTADILGGGLAGALSLAAAGGLEVGRAAEIAATALSQFKLETTETEHVADLLAAGAGKAQGSVEDLAAALNQTGLVANQTGLSIEETTGFLAAFAKDGQVGSDAGTSFKTMLQALIPRSKEAATLMEELDLSAYDASGNFIGLANYAGKLKAALSGMSDEQQAATLKTIFGSDAIRAATTLYQNGAEGIQGWIDKTNDAGYAAETAAIRLDNLKGDLEQLRGALETAFIGTGEGANGPLRELTQLVTGLVNAYNGLPGPVKGGVLAVTALTAVVGLSVFAATRAILAYQAFNANLATLGLRATTASGGVGALNARMVAARGGAMAIGAGLLFASSKIDNTKESFKGLTTAAGAAALGFAVGGPWGAAVGGGIGLLVGFAGASKNAVQNIEGLTASLDANTGAVTKNSYEWASNELVNSGQLDNIKALGLTVGDVAGAMLEDADAVAKVNAALEAAGPAFEATASSGKNVQVVVDDLGKSANSLGEFLGNSSGALDESRAKLDAEESAAAAAAAATDKVGDSAAGAEVKIRSLSDAFKDLNAALDNEASLSDYEAAVDAATAALKKNGKGLSLNTEEGRENAATLRGMASSAIGHAEAMDKDNVSIQAQRKFLQGARNDLYQQARAFGKTKQEAHDYVNEVLKIPPTAKTQIELAADRALQDVRAFKTLLDSLHDKNISINVTRHGQTEPAIASGGYITGPGTGTSDSIPAWLSNGEFVVRKAAVDSIGVGNLHAMNARGYAGGGTVRQYAHSGGSSGGDWAGVHRELALIRRGIPVAVTNIDGFDRRSQAIASGVVDDDRAFAGTAGRMR